MSVTPTDTYELHTRSHPSHFLTTRHAPPRMFPFPLGKTSAKATIKDELWWEGGNAPHVVSLLFSPFMKRVIYRLGTFQ
jgi:hypothetical protein